MLAAEGADAFTNEAHITGGVPAMAGDQTVVISDYLGNTLSQGDQQFKSTAYGEGLKKGLLTGKPYVKELGQFVFKFRNYIPEIARWTTSDPSGFPDGMNNSLYVNNDPLTRFDALGLALDAYKIDVTSGGSSPHTAGVSVSVTTSYMTYGTPTAALISQSFNPGYNLVQGSLKGNWNTTPTVTPTPANPKNYSQVVRHQMNASLTVFKVVNGQELKADLAGNQIVTTTKVYE